MWKQGGFITPERNRGKGITAKLLKEICLDKEVEPQLQQLTG